MTKKKNEKYERNIPKQKKRKILKIKIVKLEK